VSWELAQPPSPLDYSGEFNWRTDIRVSPGGYFDDLASHGLDLFHYLLGEVDHASGSSINQQGLYSAPDAVSAHWIHKSGVTGSGSWNFGSFCHQDGVKICGSEGKISFSVFQDSPVILKTNKMEQEIMIDHPKHVQLNHVKAMQRHLTEHDYSHPSTGKTALHTSWVMDKILGKI